jgi:putative ABC transport system permease protein
MAATATASIGLGIATVCTAYALLYSVVIAPFPYPNSGRLVFIWGSENPSMRRGLAFDAVRVLRGKLQSVAIVGFFLAPDEHVFQRDYVNLDAGVRVGPGVFRSLGVSPIEGHFFSDSENDGRSVVLSYRLWQRNFGGGNVIGRTVDIDGASYVISGVMPRGFFFPDETVNLWLPLSMSEAAWNDPGQGSLLAVGRLTPSSTLETARTELSTLASSNPPNRLAAIGVFAFLDTLIGRYAQSLGLLYGGSLALLVIVSINVSLLFSFATHERIGEFAVRRALGASVPRLYLQLVGEDAVLTASGILLGFLLSAAVIKAAAGISTVAYLPRGDTLALSPGVIPALALIMAAVIVMSAALGLRGFCADLPPLRHRTLSSASRIGRAGIRSVVLIELALVPGILLISILCLKSAVRAATVNWGFDASNTLLIDMRLPAGLAGRLPEQIPRIESILESFAAVKGVRAVGMGYTTPFRFGLYRRSIRVSSYDRDIGIGHDNTIVEYDVSHGYFAALGVAILQGREFGPSDTRQARRVAVVNDKLARLLGPAHSAIGQDLSIERDALTYTVVGVVASVQMGGIRGSSHPAIYLDYRQQPKDVVFGFLAPKFIVRTERAQPVLPAELTARLRVLAPDFHVAEMNWMASMEDDAIGSNGMLKILSAGALYLALIGFCLTASGIYTLTRSTVQSRRNEIGIRIALGATPRNVSWTLLRELLGLFVIGGSLGAIVAFALVKTFDANLLGLDTVDVWTGSAVVLVAILMVSAGAVPSIWSASRQSATNLLRIAQQ